jgi:RNA polymerase-binding transcription factor DksA
MTKLIETPKVLKQRASCRAYYQKHIEQQRARSRNFWNNVSDDKKEERRITRRNWQYLKKYNISFNDVLSLLEKQNGVCKICGIPISIQSSTGKGSGNLKLDHNHETGKVRGILCNNCNIGLGSFNDSVRKLESAILYLKENKQYESNRNS